MTCAQMYGIAKDCILHSFVDVLLGIFSTTNLASHKGRVCSFAMLQHALHDVIAKLVVGELLQLRYSLSWPRVQDGSNQSCLSSFVRSTRGSPRKLL